MRIIFLLLLLIVGCTKTSDLKWEEIDYRLTKEWIYAYQLDDLKNDGIEITRPPGVEQLLFSLVIPISGGLTSDRHCVFYKIPYKQTPGEIKVIHIKGIDACPETSGDESVIAIKDVTRLMVSFRNYQLGLSFKQKQNEIQEQRNLVIPLVNLELGRTHQKYLPMKERSLYPGLQFLRLSDASFDYSANKYIGKLSDRFSNGSAIRCHHVTKDCESIGENRCDQCRYGWYEVVDFQCSQGGSKFCGQNHCGEKNEPACPRGVKVVYEDEAGICQNDLEPVLNADKILVCQ
jgi:hypothetical protein